MELSLRGNANPSVSPRPRFRERSPKRASLSTSISLPSKPLPRFNLTLNLSQVNSLSSSTHCTISGRPSPLTSITSLMRSPSATFLSTLMLSGKKDSWLCCPLSFEEVPPLELVNAARADATAISADFFADGKPNDVPSVWLPDFRRGDAGYAIAVLHAWVRAHGLVGAQRFPPRASVATTVPPATRSGNPSPFRSMAS